MGYDFFRDPPGRYLGYGMVLSRSVPGSMVSPMTRVWMSRATLGYIGFDTFYQAMDNRRPNPVLKGVDALIWQGLASLVIPGMLVEGVGRVTSSLKPPLPLALTVLSLPLLGPLIDDGVDFVLDHTTRPILLR